MLKKLVLGFMLFIAAIGLAFAKVDVNTADAAALDAVKGIGPSMSKKIIDERIRAGGFRDWADLQQRVKGLGDRKTVKLSQAGLSVNGKPHPDDTQGPGRHPPVTPGKEELKQ